MKLSSDANPSRSQNPPQAIFLREDTSNSASADVPTGGILEYWRILQRRRNTVVFIALVGLIAGFLYTVPQTPVYQARAVIEIQNLNSDFLNMRDVDPNSDESGYDPTIEVQTQVHILQSNALLDRVTQKLDAETKNVDPPPTRFQTWRHILHIPERATATGAAIESRPGVSNLRVRAEANTRLIEILCDSQDPEIAAKFANTLTSEFIEQSLEARWQTTEHTGEFLGNQMQDIKIKLEQSEDAMQAYARDNNLVITDEKNDAEVLKLGQLQDELSKAQADRIQRQSDYELATRVPAESLGEVIDDASLKDTRDKLMDLRREYAELSSTLTPANPRTVKVQAQIASLTMSLQQQRGNVLARIRNDFDTAKRREDLLGANYSETAKIVADQADKLTHYNTLKREVDTNRQLYDSILQRVKEASVASALRASNIHVVDPATVPGSPYKPSIFSNTVLGLVAGLLLGIAFVVFVERADRTIQEPGDTAFYLGVPELGIIPCASIGSIRSGRAQSITPQRSSVTSREMALSTLESKPSPIAESFRATLTSILFSGENGTHPQVIVVSSASPKEGKTTLTTNLAVALAEIHKKVLLIDADLRRPSIHRFFNLKKDTGMVDLLRRAEPIVGPFNGHVRPSGVKNLSIMTSGRTVDGDPTLLHSNRLTELIELARREYDVVLIDTPPMLNMADARIIARQSDGVVLVVRANVTSRDSIKDTHRFLVEDGSPVIGSVLNDWNPKKSSRYSYYRYYDRYRQYYGDAKSIV